MSSNANKIEFGIRLALKQTGFCLHGNQKHGTNISHQRVRFVEMLTFRSFKVDLTWHMDVLQLNWHESINSAKHATRRWFTLGSVLTWKPIILRPSSFDDPKFTSIKSSPYNCKTVWSIFSSRTGWVFTIHLSVRYFGKKLFSSSILQSHLQSKCELHKEN